MCYEICFRLTSKNAVVDWFLVFVLTVVSKPSLACDFFVILMQDTQLLPSQVVSEQQSMVVIKKLLAIAVSGITYLRGLFPEKAYGHKYIEGKITKTNSFDIKLHWRLRSIYHSDQLTSKILTCFLSYDRSESDDHQRGAQLSGCKSDCSVVNNNVTLADCHWFFGHRENIWWCPFLT